MQSRGKFSSHFYDLIKRKKSLSEKFLTIFDEEKENFIKRDIDDRLAFNYATVVAGYATVFGRDDLGFLDALVVETQAMQEEFKDERAVSVFMDDLMAMRTRGIIDSKYWDVADGKIYLYFHGLHNIWSQEFRKTRGEEAFKEASIRAYLREEPGFLEMNVPKQIEGGLKKCVVFDYEDAPGAIKNLIESQGPSFTSGNSFTSQGKHLTNEF